MNIHTHCKLCKRPSSEVDIIQEKRPGKLPGESLAVGYCFDCQDLVFIGSLLVKIGLLLTFIGINLLNNGVDYITLIAGICLVFFGLKSTSIISLFYKS